MSESAQQTPAHLLDIDDRTPAQLLALLDLASILKRGQEVTPLTGRTLALLFEQPSTRTRASFEAGINRLGGSAMFLGPEDTQLARGEPIRDTARALSQYVDVVAIRVDDHDDLVEFATYADIPVINALSDRAHPCQALADILTIREHVGTFDETTAVWIGDGNNVAASFTLAAAAVGIDTHVITPPGYELSPEVLERASALGSPPAVTNEVPPSVDHADVVYTDTWVSMNEEDTQLDRAEKVADFDGFQVNERLLHSSDASVMHCLPAHRGEEVTDAVLEGDRSLVWEQAANRLFVQNAVMLSLLNDDATDLTAQQTLPIGRAL